MAEETLASWLEDMQRGMGITYTKDEAEEKLRSVLKMLLGDQIQHELLSVGYHGYREVELPDGGRERSILRTLHATISLEDGTRYYLELIGPHGPFEPSSASKARADGGRSDER